MPSLNSLQAIVTSMASGLGIAMSVIVMMQGGTASSQLFKHTFAAAPPLHGADMAFRIIGQGFQHRSPKLAEHMRKARTSYLKLQVHKSIGSQIEAANRRARKWRHVISLNLKQGRRRAKRPGEHQRAQPRSILRSCFPDYDPCDPSDTK